MLSPASVPAIPKRAKHCSPSRLPRLLPVPCRRLLRRHCTTSPAWHPFLLYHLQPPPTYRRLQTSICRLPTSHCRPLHHLTLPLSFCHILGFLLGTEEAGGRRRRRACLPGVMMQMSLRLAAAPPSAGTPVCDAITWAACLWQDVGHRTVGGGIIHTPPASKAARCLLTCLSCSGFAISCCGSATCDGSRKNNARRHVATWRSDSLRCYASSLNSTCRMLSAARYIYLRSCRACTVAYWLVLRAVIARPFVAIRLLNARGETPLWINLI